VLRDNGRRPSEQVGWPSSGAALARWRRIAETGAARNTRRSLRVDAAPVSAIFIPRSRSIEIPIARFRSDLGRGRIDPDLELTTIGLILIARSRSRVPIWIPIWIPILIPVGSILISVGSRSSPILIPRSRDLISRS